MNSLLRRLERIQSECVDKGSKNKGKDDVDLDEFSRIKRKIAADLKQVRQLIKDRDQLEKEAPGTVATVEISTQIRSLMREARNDATNLAKIFDKEKKDYIRRNKSVPEQEERIEIREQTVDLVHDHIEECKLLDQKRHGMSAFSSPSHASKEPPPSELPDIDDAGFQLLRKNDQVIDGMLDDVSKGVQELKEIATQMGHEAETQGQMLDKLDEKVDRVNEQLENINIRLAKALKSVRKADRFIVDIILLCIVLGLAGYIYKIVKG